MIIILYLSVALIAVAFLILVIYLSKTLKSVQMTLTNVASTLDGLEGQMKGITAETTELLHKTNRLAEDIQEKSEKLNTVVHAVQEVGTLIETQVYDKLPATFDKEITAGTLQSKRDVRYPLKLAKLYEEKGDYEKARQMYKEVRRAADRALTADTYQNNLPKFQEELNTILEDVRAKLEEMDMEGKSF